MARVEYADIHDPKIRPLVERIQRERSSLPNLYRMLLNSPAVAQGWLTYLTAIRQQSSLPPSLREMLILRVAVLNQADYEFEQHLPIALKEGCTQAQVESIRQGDFAALSDADGAAMRYCDEMTREIRVRDDTFAALRAVFSDQEIVEVTATIAAYNMVSRFLEAIQVDHE
ncbi:carboxymuconolactone decarboxylase family protein [Bordetella genomosp. 12]|uniref:Carboxymuconolactone decarboxylase n=1 Tax=Bordetella genomosp. 12 TaxID=463035 RepID=A0A261VER5_9BORD|nr:carboxymuconolactone decarboxylase family protein [Bordetella genomosp. 12]OZI72261.1 carboxymuconolactone decarboxylase [Bordetella genomosp. 12]